MNLQETEKLLMTIQEIYPYTKSNEVDVKGFELRVKMWHRQFEEDPFLEVFSALEIHIANSEYAPTIKHLKDIIAKNRDPELFMSGEQAWDIVSSNCVQYGFNGQSEAYKNFNQRMKETIKASGGWWEHCYSEYPHQVKARFIEAWNVKAEPEREKLIFPTSVLKRLEKFSPKALEDGK